MILCQNIEKINTIIVWMSYGPLTFVLQTPRGLQIIGWLTLVLTLYYRVYRCTRWDKAFAFAKGLSSQFLWSIFSLRNTRVSVAQFSGTLLYCQTTGSRSYLFTCQGSFCRPSVALLQSAFRLLRLGTLEPIFLKQFIWNRYSSWMLCCGAGQSSTGNATAAHLRVRLSPTCECCVLSDPSRSSDMQPRYSRLWCAVWTVRQISASSHKKFPARRSASSARPFLAARSRARCSHTHEQSAD